MKQCQAARPWSRHPVACCDGFPGVAAAPHVAGSLGQRLDSPAPAEPEQAGQRAAPTVAADGANVEDANAAPADARAARYLWTRPAAAWLTAGVAVLLALAAFTAALAPRSTPQVRVARTVIPTDAPFELAPVLGNLHPQIAPPPPRIVLVQHFAEELRARLPRENYA